MYNALVSDDSPQTKLGAVRCVNRIFCPECIAQNEDTLAIGLSLLLSGLGVGSGFDIASVLCNG